MLQSQSENECDGSNLKQKQWEVNEPYSGEF